MRIFVIGATGYVGSHVARRMLSDGHEVVGFARSVEGVAKVEGLGATALLGDIDSAEDLVRGAVDAEATVFAPQFPSQDDEFAAVSALLDSYAGTGKTFVFTSGTGVLGQPSRGEWSEESFAEDDDFIPSRWVVRRRSTELLTRAAMHRGVRAMVIRPPMIWGNGRSGMVDRLLQSVRATGKACYIGAGLNLYTNVHVDDLADLYSRAIDRGTAGALYHAAAGELNNRTLAEYVARQQGVETMSVDMAQAFEIWGKFQVLVIQAVSSRTRSPRSRRELGWVPTRLNLVEQILDGSLIAG